MVKLTPSSYYIKKNSHFCSIDYNNNWNIVGKDCNCIFYFTSNQNKNIHTVNKLSNVLFSNYTILLKYFNKNTMWQNFYAIRLSCKSLSKSSFNLINYALYYVRKYNIDILPPNILSLIYPSISYSVNNNRIIVPSLKDINKNFSKLLLE